MKKLGTIVLLLCLALPVFGQDIYELSLEDLLNMEIVSASKYNENVNETPATMVILTAKDIEERGYLSLPEVFQDLPGFDVIVAAGDNHQLVYARGNRTGSMNERTLIMVNGVEHNVLFTQHMNIDFDFPISAIKRIEFLYGPASAVYGANAFSGLINIITKDADDIKNGNNTFTSKSYAGSLNTKSSEFTYIDKMDDFDIFVSYKRYVSDRVDVTDGAGFFSEKNIIGNESVWGPFAKPYEEYDNRANDYALLSSIKFHNFKLTFNRLQTDNGNGPIYPMDKTLPTTNWIFLRNNLNFEYFSEINDKLSFKFLTSYRKDGVPGESVWASGWNSGATWDSERNIQMQTWKNMCEKWDVFQDFIYRPKDNVTVNGGVKYSYGTYQTGYVYGNGEYITYMPGDDFYLDSQGNQVDFSTANYNALYPAVVPEGEKPGNIFNDNEIGGYVQGKISLMDNKYNLVAGARYDDNSIYGKTFNPRLGATAVVTDNIIMKSNYGTAFQAPAPRNLYASWGGLAVSADLKPEEISTFDYSFIFKNKNVNSNATLFYNKVKKSVMQGTNLPDKTAYGLEYKFDYLLSNVTDNLKNVRMHFNYTYISSLYDEVRTAGTRTSDVVGGIAPHKLNFAISATVMEMCHVFLRGNYVAERPTTITNPIETVDSYFTLNGGLSLVNLFENKIKVFCNVYNMLDVEYYHPGFDAANAGEDTSAPSLGWYSSRYMQQGRTISVGFDVNL